MLTTNPIGISTSPPPGNNARTWRTTMFSIITTNAPLSSQMESGVWSAPKDVTMCTGTMSTATSSMIQKRDPAILENGG
jgi:hypothetical protein